MAVCCSTKEALGYCETVLLLCFIIGHVLGNRPRLSPENTYNLIKHSYLPAFYISFKNFTLKLSILTNFELLCTCNCISGSGMG